MKSFIKGLKSFVVLSGIGLMLSGCVVYPVRTVGYASPVYEPVAPVYGYGYYSSPPVVVAPPLFFGGGGYHGGHRW